MLSRQMIISGSAATSAMTLFSYLVSVYQKQVFLEPSLLGTLLNTFIRRKDVSIAAGWVVHYSIGITWSALFEYLVQQNKIRKTAKYGMLYGLLSGLAGIVSWDLIFRANPSKPRIKYSSFYQQLFLAHYVFVYMLILQGRMENKKLG